MKEKFILARFSSHGTRDYLFTTVDGSLLWDNSMFNATTFTSYSDCLSVLEQEVKTTSIYMYAVQKVYAIEERVV